MLRTEEALTNRIMQYIDFKMAHSLFEHLDEASVRKDILDMLNAMANTYDAAIEKKT